MQVSHRFGALVAKESADQMLDAVNLAVDKVETQAERARKKHKDRRRRAQRAETNGSHWPVEVIARDSVAPGSGTQPRVIETARLEIKPMSIEEAALELEGRNLEFIVFRDMDTERLSVLYKRRDENYGLIAPASAVVEVAMLRATAVPTLETLTDPHLIFPGLAAATPRECCASWRPARRAGVVGDAEALFQRLWEREQLGSTAIGRGIAIPHCKLDGLERVVLVAVGLAPAGVDFGAADEQPVRLFFVVVSPSRSPAEHLQSLAAISRWVKSRRRRRAPARAAATRTRSSTCCGSAA